MWTASRSNSDAFQKQEFLQTSLFKCWKCLLYDKVWNSEHTAAKWFTFTLLDGFVYSDIVKKHFYSSAMCLLSYELNWNIISIYWKLLFNIRIVGSKLFSWPFYAAVIRKFSVEIAVWLSEVGLVYHAPILSYHGNCYLRLGFYSKHQSERPN